MSAARTGGYLKLGATNEKSESARITLGAGIQVPYDILKTTLGPNGSDKILVPTGPYENLKITNDGATIMKSMNISNPSTKILANVSLAQDDNSGDGTTSVVILSCCMYRACEKLIHSKKIHPQVVLDCLAKAKDLVLAQLDKFSYKFDELDPAKLEEVLMKIAQTTLSSKNVAHNKQHFARIAVDAARRIGKNSLGSVHIIKKDGASMDESQIVDGFILNSSFGTGQRHCIENPKIMVANTQMDADKIKVFGASVKVDSIKKLNEIEHAEKSKMVDKVEAIAASKCDVFINRQLIYDFPEQLLRDKGVISVEHADFEGVERLSKILDAEIVSSFGQDIGTKQIKLGTCGKVEERTDLIQGRNEPLILFSGLKSSGACTVVLRGSTDQVLEEIDRSFHDALCVIHNLVASENKQYVLGGGCIDVCLYDALINESRSKSVTAVESLVFEEIAQAFLDIPNILAQNCGMDSASVVAHMKQSVANGSYEFGINATTKTVGNVLDLGIFESLNVRKFVLKGAFEAVMVLSRIDGIVTNTPRQRPVDRRHH